MARSKTAAPVSIPIGTNINMEADGDNVTLRMDLTQDSGPTTSGKNRRVATTGGNTAILAGLKLGVNLYDPVAGRGALTRGEVPDSPVAPMGTNLTMQVSDGILIVRFDAGQDFGPTTSGKGRRVALTGGNITIAAGLKFGLNCYDPVPAPRA